MASMHSLAALRIFGDSLDPAEISARLGCEPSTGYLKGHTFATSTGAVVTRKTGAWILTTSDTEPADLDAQIREILARLSSDPAAWTSLPRDYELDVMFGLFMEESSEVAYISVATLRELADRNIQFRLDLYSPTETPGIS